MKKTYLFVLTCACFNLAKATNPVPNYSFESWTGGTYSNPVDWNTNNEDPYIPVMQVAPGYNSPYAAKGQTYLDELGLATRTPVLEAIGSGNGFPITQNYNNFEFYFKTKLILGDVFIASVLIEDASHDSIAAGIDTISISDSAFTVMDVGINYLNSNAAASAIIIFSLHHGAGSGNDTVSYFIVDNVSLDSIITTGLQNITGESKLNIFPVPAHDWLTVKSPIPNAKPFQLTLTDVTGRAAIERNSVTSNSNFIDEQLNLGGIAPGIYFLMLVSDQGVLTRKVVIQ